MNALINLKDCREYMVVTINSENHNIRLSGTIQSPYFCGKDICRVLGYKDPKDALRKFVDRDDKCDLNELNSKRGQTEDEKMGGCHTPPKIIIIWVVILTLFVKIK
jgi:hypothetical protein